jgi:hypothetical protein
MTVILGYDPSTGYCLMDLTGNYVCAIWFGSEEDALDYCEKHDLYVQTFWHTEKGEEI